MKTKYDGSISVFLALVMLIIVSLILVMLESARHAASESYAHILLRTAEESILGDYCGPLFADYHILALDTGFGSKTGDTDEFERKMKKYMGDNVWGFVNKSVHITDERKLLDEMGTEFLNQAIEYEKYAAVEDVLDEVLSRIKNLGNQSDITKIMEKKMGIEDELSVIDMYTLRLMGIIDGVTLTLGSKAASLLGYDIEQDFIKRFFIGDVSMGGTGINNPKVYENLSSLYVNPIKMLDDYRAALEEHGKLLDEVDDVLLIIEELNASITQYDNSLNDAYKSLDDNELKQESVYEKLEEYVEKIDEADEIEDSDKAQEQRDLYEGLKQEAEEELETLLEEETGILNVISELQASMASLEQEKETYEDEISEKLDVLGEQLYDCNTRAYNLLNLFSNTKDLLYEAKDLTENAADQQEKVRPMVEEFEELMKVFGPILSEDTKKDFEDTLDYMKAYVGMGSGSIKTTDFDSIRKTAIYDIAIMEKIDLSVFWELGQDTVDEVNRRLEISENYNSIISEFSYSGFYFDYSEIQENTLENKLIAEFESNVAEGYLKLFLKSGTEISDNYMLSELLPSYWFEITESPDEDLGSITSGAENKGGGELLAEADEGSGISDIVSLLGEGVEAVAGKLLTAMYMEHHFKSFRNKSTTGDTVLDYEIEYILSGYETDAANLSAAITKIMLLRLAVCTVYTMTNKEAKVQAQVLATSIVGYTGLPFLVTLVKYLILFLWATAQAVIETAAIVRGKKVPVITNKNSFCLTLAELPAFASLVSEKADNFFESEVYLDYDNYLLVLLLIQGKKTQAARAMDLIQENIRYKYDEDFLMSNAVTGFSCTAEFEAPYKFLRLPNMSRVYSITVNDAVTY